jgi:ankyrin repeat protein
MSRDSTVSLKTYDHTEDYEGKKFSKLISKIIVRVFSLYTHLPRVLISFILKYDSREIIGKDLKEQCIENIAKFLSTLMMETQDIPDFFFFAIEYNHMKIIENIEKQNLLKEIKINEKNCNRQTALSLAVQRSSPVIVRKILTMKADVNSLPVSIDENKRDTKASETRVSYQLGDTHLHLAVRRIEASPKGDRSHEAVEVLSTLLEFKANPDICNHKKETPLHILLNLGRQEENLCLGEALIEPCKDLLRAKANVTMLDKDHRSSLYLAMVGQNVSLMMTFFEFDNGTLFNKFKDFYNTSIVNQFLNIGMSGSLKRGEVKNMRSVIWHLREKEKAGERNTRTHQAVEQVKQYIINSPT